MPNGLGPTSTRTHTPEEIEKWHKARQERRERQANGEKPEPVTNYPRTYRPARRFQYTK